MKYKGHIGSLMDSIYVRDKLPKHRKKLKNRLVKKPVQRRTAQPSVAQVDDLERSQFALKAILDDIRLKHGAEILIRGEQTAIPEGFVYLVTHPLYEGWVKAGMTVDYELRMSTYNTSDPMQRFQLESVRWVPNRRQAERELLTALAVESHESRSEWFRIDLVAAKQIFDR